MLRATILVLLAILLLAAPGAQAGLFDRETAIVVAPERAGDRLSYELLYSHAKEEVARERVLLVEGASRAIDPYGIERATVSYRADTTRANEVEWSLRCHRLADGLDVVRVDHMDPPTTRTGSSTLGSTVRGAEVRAVSADTGACAATAALAGRTLREGQALRLDEVEPALVARGEPPLSSPAEAVRFEGRKALRVAFDVEGATLRYTYADGLPGFAERAYERDLPDGSRYAERMVLRGYAPGEGGALAAHAGAKLPPRHPDASFAPPDPLALDDAPFALPFPYADAYRALLADPASGFREWQRAHPEAVLAWATYDREMRDGATLALSTRGGWQLAFADAREGVMYTVVRVDGASTPLGPLASPQPTDRVGAQERFAVTEPVALPAEVADSATLAKVAAAHGVEPTAVTALHYAPDDAFLQITIGGKGEARHLTLDVARAAVTGSFVTAEPTPLLPFFRGGVASEERVVFAAIPAPPAIVATGAAAGVGALLALLLVPLFTRLRRDRLLDNPVRARLYERIRTEPGIHRAELVDFAGIGEGATRHHLAQLAKHRLVVEAASEGYVRYFAAGEVPPDVARREALLRAGSHRAVYELYAREPRLSLRDAAARLGMSAPSVHRAKKKLESAGLLPAAPDAAHAVAKV